MKKKMEDKLFTAAYNDGVYFSRDDVDIIIESAKHKDIPFFLKLNDKVSNLLKEIEVKNPGCEMPKTMRFGTAGAFISYPYLQEIIDCGLNNDFQGILDHLHTDLKKLAETEKLLEEHKKRQSTSLDNPN